MRAKSYQLHIRVKTPVMIVIGKLGMFEFPAGEYVYTGSGKRNIKERVSRHLSRSKHLRWHIDHLLSSPEVQVIGYALSEGPECDINRKTAGDVIVPRFGSTDCRSGCGSHLKFIGLKELSEMDWEESTDRKADDSATQEGSDIQVLQSFAGCNEWEGVRPRE